MSGEKKISLPADTSLTSKNFMLNKDGSVTIKNKELSTYLADKLQASVANKSVDSEYVGVVWG